VSRQFTGLEGNTSNAPPPLKAQQICEGQWDKLPEEAFMYVGSIEDAEQKAATLTSKEK